MTSIVKPTAMRAAILAASLTAFAATPAAAEEDFNIWTGQFIVLDLDKEGEWFVRGEAQERFTNDADRLGQLLLRSLVGYRISDRVSIGAGYAYILTDPIGPVETNEHRFYQELNIRLIETPGGITLDSRNRFEQRTFEEDGEVALRFRPFLQLRVPITDNNKLVAYTEPFFALNETPLQDDGLQIWRNFVGFSIPVAQGVEVVPGYLNQTVFRDGENRADHVANVNVFMNF
ncbi:hypothetical protein CD351_07780 [Erythrobacter sp. KY5]|nr:hypothetical protein CD351_07780 [Erythrobacter sp. KY5]